MEGIWDFLPIFITPQMYLRLPLCSRLWEILLNLQLDWYLTDLMKNQFDWYLIDLSIFSALFSLIFLAMIYLGYVFLCD